MTTKKMHKIFAAVFCILALTVLVVPTKSAYAATQDRVNNNTQGNTTVEGNNDVDVDGSLKNNESQSSNTKPSTKPSTDDVGKGLGDKVSSNAKTGDILNSRNMIVLFIAVGALLVIVVNRERRKTQIEETE